MKMVSWRVSLYGDIKILREQKQHEDWGINKLNCNTFLAKWLSKPKPGLRINWALGHHALTGLPFKFNFKKLYPFILTTVIAFLCIQLYNFVLFYNVQSSIIDNKDYHLCLRCSSQLQVYKIHHRISILYLL